jgi:hypothetical protein
VEGGTNKYGIEGDEWEKGHIFTSFLFFVGWSANVGKETMWRREGTQ